MLLHVVLNAFINKYNSSPSKYSSCFGQFNLVSTLVHAFFRREMGSDVHVTPTPIKPPHFAFLLCFYEKEPLSIQATHTSFHYFLKFPTWFDANDDAWHYTWWYYTYGDESIVELVDSAVVSWLVCAWYGRTFAMAVVCVIENNGKRRNGCVFENGYYMQTKLGI